MFGENASFIKTVEIDDSIFQCNPECAEKYLLQLEWSRDNEAWQWRVLKKSDVLTWSNANASAATPTQDLSGLIERIWSLESAVQALQQSSVEPSPEAPEEPDPTDPEEPSNDVEPDPEEPGL